MVLAFPASKPDVGAYHCLEHQPHSGQSFRDTRTLLAVLDVHYGMTAFMLEMDSYSVVKAAQKHAERHETPKLVTSVADLDVFPAGKLAPGCRIDRLQIRDLLGVERRSYAVTWLDLSGLLEAFSVEIL